MIRGTYKFYSEGKLIAEQNNALTSNGRTIAIKSLLGIVPNFAGTIAYGISDKANTINLTTKLVTDTCLQFELGRAPVIGSSLDISNNNDILVYTATLNDPYQYQIYEVGLFPSPLRNSSIGLAGSTLFDFDRVDLFNKFGTASGAFLTQAVEARIGTSLYFLPQTNGTDSYISYSSNDNTLALVNGFTSQDTFRLAGFKSTLSSASVNMRFYTDSLNYFDYTFPVSSASGYFITELEKGLTSVVGLPSWSNIESTRIWSNTDSGIYLDGLRIDVGSYIIDTLTGMVSRAVLPEPVRKPAGIPLTIEYSLALDFNYGAS